MLKMLFHILYFMFDLVRPLPENHLVERNLVMKFDHYCVNNSGIGLHSFKFFKVVMICEIIKCTCYFKNVHYYHDM